jgi:hypothetical protein
MLGRDTYCLLKAEWFDSVWQAMSTTASSVTLYAHVPEMD